MTDENVLDQYLSKPQLRKRYNKTGKTIREWELNGILPPADLEIAGRKYWLLRTVEAAERDNMSRRKSEVAA